MFFLFVVKAGTPTDDDLEKLGADFTIRHKDLSDPQDEAYDQLPENGFNIVKHWRQKIGTTATNQAFCDALQRDLVQCQDLAQKFR